MRNSLVNITEQSYEMKNWGQDHEGAGTSRDPEGSLKKGARTLRGDH